MIKEVDWDKSGIPPSASVSEYIFLTSSPPPGNSFTYGIPNFKFLAQSNYSAGYHYLSFEPPMTWPEASMLYFYTAFSGKLPILYDSKTAYPDFIVQSNSKLTDPNPLIKPAIIARILTTDEMLHPQLYNNFSRSFRFTHVYSSPGSYNATASFVCNGRTYTANQLIRVGPCKFCSLKRSTLCHINYLPTNVFY